MNFDPETVKGLKATLKEAVSNEEIGVDCKLKLVGDMLEVVLTLLVNLEHKVDNNFYMLKMSQQ